MVPMIRYDSFIYTETPFLQGVKRGRGHNLQLIHPSIRADKNLILKHTNILRYNARAKFLFHALRGDFRTGAAAISTNQSAARRR